MFPATARAVMLPPFSVRTKPLATVMLLPASKFTFPFCASNEDVPPKAMLPMPERTMSAPAAKSRPACNVTDQFSPARMLAPLAMVMLLPASSFNKLPGVLSPVLAARSQSVETVMLFSA